MKDLKPELIDSLLYGGWTAYVREQKKKARRLIKKIAPYQGLKPDLVIFDQFPKIKNKVKK